MSVNDSLRIGIVGGTRLPGNVQTFLENLEKLLDDSSQKFDLDLLISEHIACDFQHYQIINPGFGKQDRAVGTFLALVSGIKNYTKEYSPDLLFQVTEFPLHASATSIIAHRTETPVLTRFSGDSFREYHYTTQFISKMKEFGLNNLVGKIPVYLSTGTIVLGPNGRNEILRRNQNASLWTIPQPINESHFSPVSDKEKSQLRRDLNLNTDKRILLTVGRLTYRKGIDDLIKTAAKLDANEVTWCVIGDGDLRQQVESINSTKTIGRIPHDNINKYFQAADLVVHPSRIEGLPNVLLEAAACGTPSIARDVGECSLVASRTFQDLSSLYNIVHNDYDPVPLGPPFDNNVIRELYTEAIIKTARNTS